MPNLTALLLVAILMAGLDWPRQAHAESGIDAKRAGELEHLVRQDCGSCHGMTLKGGLGPDLVARLEGSAPEALAQIILDGVPGTPMPPWRPLITEAEARWIADYLLKETVE